MPVTTQTFRNQNKLHWVFAISAVALAGVTMIAVIEDWMNDYRKPQVEARVWEGARAAWDREVVEFQKDQMDLDALARRLEEETARIEASPEYQEIEAQMAELRDEKDRITKRLQLQITGNISPVEQRIEWLNSLEQIDDSVRDELVALNEELAYYLEEKRVGENRVREIDNEVEALKDRRRDLLAPIADLEAQVTAQRVKVDKATERFHELNPGLVLGLGQKLQNAPLLDWMNPSIRVEQQLVEGVYTELNVKQVASLDRCMSCHINIDNEAYAEDRVLGFLEKQIAVDEGERVLMMGDSQPVVMLDFWERVVTRLDDRSLDGQPGEKLREAQAEAISSYNRLLARADANHPVRAAWDELTGGDGEASASLGGADDLQSMLAAIRGRQTDAEDWSEWFAPLSKYRQKLIVIAEESINEDERRALFDTYRYTLVDAYNAGGRDENRRTLSASRLMLAHPDLDLYAHPDSKHPIATMGCTSCHAGSGEETQFLHSAHVPSDIWVDSGTGMLVPDFLVDAIGSKGDITRMRRGGAGDTARAPGTSGGSEVEVVRLGMGSGAAMDDEAHGADEGVDVVAADRAHAPGHIDGPHDDHAVGERIHSDLYFANDTFAPDPYGPPTEVHDNYALYMDPANGAHVTATKQKYWWKAEYGWKEIKYHYWERPMHELRFVESSCARCHEDIVDVDAHAETLAKGRRLFAEVGCVNCHANDRLGSPVAGLPGKPDVRQVGPSLTHVRHKLSEDMIASWTWSPKAFRPNTRMPHFWMLENNSSPIDIRRSRAEVSAISYYLANVDENGDFINPESSEAETVAIPGFEPLPTTDDGAPLSGNPAKGREIFNTVGCLACHANVNEHGLEWVTLDLQERFGLDRQEAYARMAEDAAEIEAHGLDADGEATNVGFFELAANGVPTSTIRPEQYNRLQWYLMTYQPDRYTRVGPDLSAVGTKLRHDRSEEQATGWLYNWLRQPSHYNSYTIMPSLRLTESEAMDLTAYLLTLEHPNYEVQSFPADEQMADALLVNLQANAISEQEARNKVRAMTLEEKQFDLGSRMIQHYGCYGCHEIPGFDSTMAVSANITSWGVRDPHKLDFGFFDHPYDDNRPKTAEIWKTYRWGTDADSVAIDEHSIGEHGLYQVEVPWEHVHVDRRGYLEAKLHDTRIFDRYRGSYEGAMAETGEVLLTDVETRTRRLVERDGVYIDLETGAETDLVARDVEILDVGKPYLKLRMPNFFLKASDVEALVTYVTSQMPPLVDESLQDTKDEAGELRADGKLMAQAFNCFGCHNIERNYTTIEQYYTVRRDDGSVNFSETVANMVNAPPRLIGNGAKTQHDWFYGFLNNVVMIRPWLEVRMPSFHLNGEQTTHLVNYLAGATKTDGRHIDEKMGDAGDQLWATYLTVYGAELEKALAAGEGELQADLVAKTAANRAVGEMLATPVLDSVRDAIGDMMTDYELFPPNQLPNLDMSDEERAIKYAQGFYDLSFLRETYEEINYPFVEINAPEMDELEFRRGERIIEDLGCLKCHAFGDYDLLERIFDEEQAALLEAAGAFEDEGGDPYGDDPYGDDPYGAEEDPYGAEDDPYGAEEDPYGAEEDPYGADDAYADVAQEDPYGDANDGPTAPSFYDNISAPNLALSHKRLQPEYLVQWLRKPGSIMPGTMMPYHWGPDGTVSAFAAFPPALRAEKEALYGRTADEQINLIVDWLIVAGDRRFTKDVYKLADEPTKEEAVAKRAELDAKLDSEAQATRDRWAEEAARRAAEAGEPAPVVVEEPKPEVEERPTRRPPTSRGVLPPEEAAASREAAMSEVMTVETEGYGKIAGVVVFDQPVRPRRVAGNADCNQVHQQEGTRLVEQDLIQNDNRTLKDCLVYVRNAPDDFGGVPDGPEDLIDQYGCVYIPHVKSLTAGETLAIRNSDSFAHNLNIAPESNSGFNVSQPVAGMIHRTSFSTPEMNMRLKCDVHNWMGALIHVFDHPFHSVTDERGVFEIEGLPAGDYTVVLVHERLGEREFEVTVEPGQAARIDADFGG
ncbi:MAG: hypothetical protein ACF8PN_14815 [Phycisphaerales bacterium]